MSLTHSLTFHKLRIADVRRETADCVSIAFTVPDALCDPYRFTPGQYLTLRTVRDGEELRRAYSICSAPDDSELRIAIKRVPGGRFSAWATTDLIIGDTLDVMTPMGRFGADILGDGQTYVALAAGSGITPILSIMRSVLAREPRSHFVLLLGNRRIADIIFREQIQDLKDCYLAQFSVFHVLSGEQQDLPVLSGRLDARLLQTVLPTLVPILAIDHVLICGPQEMSDALLPALRELGIAADRIQTERFTAAPGASVTRAPPIAESAPRAIVTAILGGTAVKFPVHGDDALIDAAQRAGLDLPFSCKGGMCCTCRAKILEGTVEMTVNYSLEPWEIKAGFVLTCQSRPTRARVTVDYDQV